MPLVTSALGAGAERARSRGGRGDRKPVKWKRRARWSGRRKRFLRIVPQGAAELRIDFVVASAPIETQIPLNHSVSLTLADRLAALWGFGPLQSGGANS